MTPGGEVLIVGATGSAGSRVANLALESGLRPVLYGRRRQALEQVAPGAGLRVAVGSLEADDLDRACDGIAVVVSGVGPYTKLGASVIEAALRAGAHYLDFSGEPRWVDDVSRRYAPEAVRQGSIVVPSVGLGAAGDLAAQFASAGVPEVEHLTVGYRIVGMKPSVATALSTIEILRGGAPRYESGEVRFGRTGQRARPLPGGRGTGWPLPDPIALASAWPDATIEACMQVPAAGLMGKALSGVSRALEKPVVADYARRTLARRLGGDGDHGSGGRATATAVAKGRGRACAAEVYVDDVYDFTGRAGLATVLGLLNSQQRYGLRTWGSVVGDPWSAVEALKCRVGPIRSESSNERY
jgi:hypothetical protein